MARSATSEHSEEAGRPASVSEDELEDAPGAFPDSEEEGEDDEETELEHAARAGIRLLEENAQLREELHQLQEQCAQAESEKEELLRLVAEKEQQERQLSDHLRECIRENQGVLSELSKAKEQIDELKAQQAQAQTNRAADEPPSSEEPSPAHSGGSPDKPEFIPAVRRNSMSTVLESDSEVEAKFEEAHRRNSVLGRELASAHKQIGELKPLQLQLREFELEVQLLRAKVEEQAREIGSSVEEREEERELIASLRHTIEIYQTLDDPNKPPYCKIYSSDFEFSGKREDLLSEGDDTSWENSAAVYETLVDHTEECQTKEEQAEAEHICFSILRRLVDSWTTDKAKRMRLHDWLTNAIRGTGKRRPLYLYGLSGEIASGFQVLLVPILREKFGVEVQIEKRLRNVIVTDLKMQVTGADAAKAKACLQRISRSLLWLIDVESALIEDQEWVGEYARRKAAKMCANI
ncbi:hypothetical protein JG688_00007201 [Phytophthora aleatoria]|uniref:G protein gamma domain-containing protein n=1 Tax=Phytophthora aleatoria TaxID=2496075 RepID=A0A8J5J006_9STRA|nr:hypothetical protein JG688_00007201 [Phytophthora aleatoria]